VYVATAAVRHYKAEAFLVIEEFYLALDHWAAWARIPVTISAAAETARTAEPIGITKTVPAPASAKPVTAAEPVVTTKSAAITELTGWAPWSCGFRRTSIDAVNRHDLQPTRGILQVADDSRTLEKAGSA